MVLKTICANTCATMLMGSSGERRMKVRNKGQRDRREVKDKRTRGRVRDERKTFTAFSIMYRYISFKLKKGESKGWRSSKGTEQKWGTDGQGRE